MKWRKRQRQKTDERFLSAYIDSPKWPDGKRHSRSVYADTESKCEAKLAGLIRQMKAEIAEAKELTAQGRIDEAMVLANEKKPRGVRRAEPTAAGTL